MAAVLGAYSVGLPARQSVSRPQNRRGGGRTSSRTALSFPAHGPKHLTVGTARRSDSRGMCPSGARAATPQVNFATSRSMISQAFAM